jgi:hypothetical protein
MVALGGYVTYALAVNARLNFTLSAVIAILVVAAGGCPRQASDGAARRWCE